MSSLPNPQRAVAESWSDEQIVARVLAGDTGAFEIIMRRYNQRLYRAAVSILRSDADAEDVMQETYLRAFAHLSQFEGRAKFSTWLTRIAVHEALARNRRGRRMEPLDDIASREAEPAALTIANNPEKEATMRELHEVLQEAILGLPESYRTVIVLRDVEEMSSTEAAEVLDITEDNLKMRLHRARAALREQLFDRIGPSAVRAFEFPAVRCDRVVAGVFRRLEESRG
jgi:RNA polymerase sigma-70 factor (ECF subfamily)